VFCCHDCIFYPKSLSKKATRKAKHQQKTGFFTCPERVEPGLGFLVGLVAEMPVDPLDHRHGVSRHTGDQQHVHAPHEHSNPVQPRSNPTRPRFSERRIFRDSHFFELFPSPAWESREVTHKQKSGDGGRPRTHPLGTSSYEKPPNSWDSNSVRDPTSPSPLNSLVSSDGGRSSFRPSAPDRRPTFVLDYLPIPPLSQLSLGDEPSLARFLNSVL